MDNVLVASANTGWIQTVSDTLTWIFNRVGLRTNVRKTVGMVCQPFRVVEVQADEAYKIRMTGEGQRYQERQQEQVQCLECGKDLARGSLASHRQTQYGVARGGAG